MIFFEIGGEWFGVVGRFCMFGRDHDDGSDLFQFYLDSLKNKNKNRRRRWKKKMTNCKKKYVHNSFKIITRF